jgi:chromosomal replication initiator protein
LIDDIQFIAGKETMQEEFFHTFSALYEANKQIIMTSDRHPREIQPLEDRLRTRFEGSCIADVQPPSLELRLAIIRKKSADMGLVIEDELINYMAERLQNNIRQIEGVLKRIGALRSMSSGGLTREKLEEIISIIAPDSIPPDVMVEKILSVVAKKNGLRPEDLKSKKRQDNIAKARHVAIYIARHLTTLPLQTIGKIFNRDHSTIISSIEKVEIDIKTRKNAHAEILSLIKEIKG